MKKITLLTYLMSLSVMSLFAQNVEVEGKAKITVMDTVTNVSANVVRQSDGTLALRHYKIGDLAHGGIVFYVNETGEHGLISDTVDLASPANAADVSHQWSTVSEVTGATGDGIGAGAMNTLLILSAQRGDTDSAARLCADLVRGGYGDWYLPSKEELNLMYTKIGVGAAAPNTNIGGFADAFYWSSTEVSSDGVRQQFFGDGNQVVNLKNGNFRVRAIRAF